MESRHGSMSAEGEHGAPALSQKEMASYKLQSGFQTYLYVASSSYRQESKLIPLCLAISIWKHLVTPWAIYIS